MISEILGKQNAEDIFYSSMLTGLMNEKQAEETLHELEKSGGIWKDIWSGTKDVLKGGKTVFSGLKEIPSIFGWTALAGGATGVLGATAYDAIKDSISKEDPEEKFNNDIEALYKSRKKELEDSNWMSRVRALRDELRRGYKKMSTDEYSKKYKELIDALDERRA